MNPVFCFGIGTVVVAIGMYLLFLIGHLVSFLFGFEEGVGVNIVVGALIVGTILLAGILIFGAGEFVCHTWIRYHG